MSPLLTPTRFQLSTDQLGAALALARLRPTRRSNLPDVPPPADPVAALRGTRVLANGHAALSEEALAALSVAADPGRLLSMAYNRAGFPEWAEAVFYSQSDEGPYVVLAEQNGSFDLALVPSATAAAVLMDDLLGLTTMPAEPDQAPVTLSLAGYAALLAAADHLQMERLRARIARARQPEPVLTQEALEPQLQQGLSTADTRWAVTAARYVCPADLRMAVGRTGLGLAELQRVGLTAAGPQGYRFTEPGYDLAKALERIISSAGFSLAIASAQDRLTIAHASLFRTLQGILMASWSQVSAQDASVRLLTVSASGALGLIRGLLQPIELPQPPAPLRFAPAPAAAPAYTQPAAFVPPSPASSVAPPPPGSFTPVTPPAPVAAPPTAVGPTATTPPRPATGPKFCPQCGARLEPGKRFCGSCGHRLMA